MIIRRKKKKIEIQMAPLIDCVFLLLIYFMVSTIMRVPPPFPVNLPVSETKHEFPRKRYNLYISARGEISVDNKLMRDMDELELFLASNANRIETLLIKADRKAKHGLVIDAMERAKLRNIQTLAIAIREPGTSSKGL